MIPEFESFILPTLIVLSDGKVHSLSETKESVVKHFGFSKEELSETTRSGNNTKVNDRITWALTYLRQSGLVDSPQRAYAKITALGEKLLENPPKVITRDYLFSHYPSFRDFQNRSRRKKESRKYSLTNDINFEKNIEQDSSIKDPMLEDLNNLRLAIRSFEKIGIKPTKEQIEKLSELEGKVICEALSNKIKNLFNNDITHIIKQFVVNIKYDNGQIFLHVDTANQSLSSFPDNSFLVNKTFEQPIKQNRKRRPNLNFFEMGLITGDVLHYNDDKGISVTVVNENKVEYNGSEYSLTKLTQELKGLSHAIQPTGEWNFEGQNLLDLYNDTYKDN